MRNFSSKVFLTLIALTTTVYATQTVKSSTWEEKNIGTLSEKDILERKTKLLRELGQFCQQCANGHPLTKSDIQRISEIKEEYLSLERQEHVVPFSINRAREVIEKTKRNVFDPRGDPNHNLPSEPFSIAATRVAQESTCSVVDRINDRIVKCEKDAIKTLNTCCDNVAKKLACTPIIKITQADIPFNITQPGRYCLAEDVTSTDFVIISISSFDVELDLAGHIIDGLGSAMFGIVVTSSTNVTVKNGIITNCFADLSMQFGVQNIFAHNLVLSNASVGIPVFSDVFGILIDQCILKNFSDNGILGFSDVSNLVVSNCSFTNGTNFGIQLVSPIVNCVIKSCTFENFFRGIQLEYLAEITSNLKILDCCLRNIQDLAINLISEVENIRISGCQVENALGGLHLDTCRGAIVTDFEISDCTTGITAELCKNLFFKSVQVSGTIGFPAESFNLSENVVLESCTYTGANMTPNVRTTHFAVTACSNFVMRNCYINYLGNVPYENTNALTITRSTGIEVSDCTVETNAKAINGLDGNGILINGGVNNCLVHDCLIVSDPMDPMLNGINILPLENTSKNCGIIIDGCNIESCNDSGVVTDDAVECKIVGCNIRRTLTGSGIDVKDSTGIEIINNTSKDNAVDGIRLDTMTTQCPVRDNTTYKNGDVGLRNLGGATNRIFGNFSHSNTTSNFSGVSLTAAPATGLSKLINVDG